VLGGSRTPLRILDAGAGTGLIQWYLAEQGAEVISVDRMSRAQLPLRFRQRFRVKGMRQQDLAPIRQVFRNRWKDAGGLQVKIKNQLKDLSGLMNLHRSTGKVIVYNQDLRNLVDIPENSIDLVVSVSALEHNPPENLTLVQAELLRVLRPGGALLATLCAADQQDWLHEPSQGWCYTDASLRRLFALAEDAPSNYHRYDELFQALRECAELRDNLARFYYRSGEGGMPWGVWDPKYQPVGVCKTKAM
jgi:SAM-dependent methyltransferase